MLLINRSLFVIVYHSIKKGQLRKTEVKDKDVSTEEWPAYIRDWPIFIYTFLTTGYNFRIESRDGVRKELPAGFIETLLQLIVVCYTMSLRAPEVDLRGIRDPQKPITLLVGLVFIVVGVAALTGVLDMAPAGGDANLLLGYFGIPLWLGVTVIVAGLLGAVLAGYGGGATTFNKVAAGLVLPAVLFLAITDWALAAGGTLALAVGVVTLLLAVALVVVGLVLFWGNPLAFVMPVVAVLAIADWVLGLTAMLPTESVTFPTLGLLVVLAVVIGLVGFEGGRRMTGRPL